MRYLNLGQADQLAPEVMRQLSRRALEDVVDDPDSNNRKQRYWIG